LEERHVSWGELRERWNEFSALASQQWQLLTARDLRVIAGNRERLIGILQQRYGAHHRTVEREVRAFTRAFGRTAAEPIAEPPTH
jgi:uncharacterized protein YjbJ (UPF0337 family)